MDLRTPPNQPHPTAQAIAILALAFAGNICQSESPTVAYATVYLLTMLLRIQAAQAHAVGLCG